MKKILSLLLAIVLISTIFPMLVFAEANVNFTDFSSETPANWRINQNTTASVSDGVFEIKAGEPTLLSEWRLPQAYPSGTVVVEYDFKSTGEQANVFIQNPNGGSICRLQQKKTTVVQVQHSDAAATANENTLLTGNFAADTWYHVKHVIIFRDNSVDITARTTSSTYLYDTKGALIGSAENKTYMDASKYPSPTCLQVVTVFNPGTSGSVYFDNFAVYEQTEESVIAINKRTLGIENADSVREDITLKTVGYGNAEILWESSNEGIITKDGKVSKVSQITDVTLTATIKYGNTTSTVDFPVKVLPEDESVVNGIVYAFDFNDNANPTGLSVKTTEGFNGVRNKRLELSKPEGATVNTNPQTVFYFDRMQHGAFSERLIVEFDYSSTSDVGPIAYFQASPNPGSVVRIEQIDATTLSVTTGGTGETPVSTKAKDKNFIRGKVYHAKVILDYDSQRCSVYIDGIPFAQNHHFMPCECPGALNAMLTLNNGTSGTIAIDNLVLYNDGDDEAVLVTEKMLDIEEKALVTESLSLPTAGYNGASIAWESSMPEIISNTGELVSLPTINTSVQLTAAITKGIKQLTKNITVMVKGVPDYPSVTFSEPTVSVNQDGDEIVTISLTKPRAQEVSFCFIASSFDKNGVLLDTSYGNKTVYVNQASGELTINMPDKKNEESGTIKYYIWDSMNTMLPLTDSTTVDFVTDGAATIACWGDSLTYGQGSTNCTTTGEYSYPGVLERLTGETVYNMGVGGETAMTIAARQGAVDMILTEDFTIPETGSVNIPLAYTESDGEKQYYIATADNGKVVPRDVNSAMWNPVTINGVQGTLSVSVNTNLSMRMLNSATFTRSEAGAAVNVKAGSKIETAASKLRADINVFFTGTNGGWNADNIKARDDAGEAAELVSLIRAQIAKTKDPSKYIVIGLTNGNGTKWQNTNSLMEEAFGEHFLDAKAYLATAQALTDSEITATQQDLEDLASGTIPTSLRVDSTHFNDAGYELLAKLVHKKLNELGYLYKSEICEVKDNKKAIRTFTSDDSLTASCNYFNEEFTKNGLCGSLAMVVKKFYNSDGTLNNDKVNAFKSILESGNFDITNHSYNHTSPKDNYMDTEYWTNEIDGAQAWFENTFEGEKVFTVANPLAVSYDSIDEIIKVNNWAARNGKGAAYNSLNPTEDEWFHLRWQHANEFCTVDSMKEWVDTAIEGKQWLIELWHGVDGEGSSPVQSSVATPYFEYVASKKGEIWVATLNEAVQYLREKQHASMETGVNADGKLEVVITHDLPMDIFNYPLSVRTRVPGNWNTVKITQGDNVQTVNVSSRHIVYDVIPNGTKALIEKIN